MKFLIKSCSMAALSMSLMACTIGNGRSCGPRTRIDLDLLCGAANERCVIQRNPDNTPILDRNGKTQLALNSQRLVQFDSEAAGGKSLAEFLETSGLDRTGTCGSGMSKEQRYKLLHPKAYGEYWVKPDMTKESWRQDWVACGGDLNGQYGVYTPPKSTTQVVLAAQKREAQRLAVCMQSKSYEYRYEP